MLIAKNIKTKHPTNKMMIKTYFALFMQKILDDFSLKELSCLKIGAKCFVKKN